MVPVPIAIAEVGVIIDLHLIAGPDPIRLRISVSAKAAEQQCVTEYPRHEELTSGSIAAQDADGAAGKVAGRLFGQRESAQLVRPRPDCHEGTRLTVARHAGAPVSRRVRGRADIAHPTHTP